MNEFIKDRIFDSDEIGAIDEFLPRGIRDVQQESYEVVEPKTGGYAIKIAGASIGNGNICKFTKREGREYMQKARAIRLVRSANAFDKLRKALSAIVGIDGRGSEKEHLKALDVVIRSSCAPEQDKVAALHAIQVLLETLPDEET